MSVAAEIRAELARQNKTVQDLSEQMGVRYEPLRVRINGAIDMRTADLEAISAALGVPAWELLRRADDNGSTAAA